MLVDIASKGGAGNMINLEELGMTKESVAEAVENMNENEKILEDMQKPFE